MKNTIRRFCLILVLFISVVWLSGCKGLVKPTLTPTLTSTFTQTNTSTHTSTITLTPTLSPTETLTNTITTTFTETPAYNLPGYYYIAKCAYFTPSGVPPTIQATFCVNSVTVNNDSTMQFNVRWRVNASGYIVHKHSDTNNYNMFLEDDLKNKYKHIGVGGCAATDITWTEEGDCNGWFLFPAAKPGAKAFRFYDWDNKIYIENIVLAHGNVPTLTFTPKPTLGSYNSTGTYWIYKCTSFVPITNFPGAQYVTLCINTVVINDKNEMRFNVHWKMEYSSNNTWKKPSDANNYSIYLQDNLGNSYTHINTGGCAGQETTIAFYSKSGDCNGWFQFPPAKAGVTSFQFIDSANHAMVDNIILLPK